MIAAVYICRSICSHISNTVPPRVDEFRRDMSSPKTFAESRLTGSIEMSCERTTDRA